MAQPLQTASSPPKMHTKNTSGTNVPPLPHRGTIATVGALVAFASVASAQVNFTHNIGFDVFGYQHGSIVEGNAYAGSFLYAAPLITVTPPSGGYNKAVIFNTQDPQVPGNTTDPDLIPNGTGNLGGGSFGNLAIIQENTAFTITAGRMNDPYRKVDDHANGGTFRFDFNPVSGAKVNEFRLDLIDIETTDQIRVVAYGPSGSFTWTGADLKALNSSISYADGSANRTSFLTASQAGLASITRVDVISSTSFALDNLTFKGTVIPEVSSSLLTAASGLLLCFRRRRSS